MPASDRLVLRTSLDGIGPAELARTVYLPALDGAPPGLVELLALLPVADVNGALMAALAGRSFSRAAPVAAVFCVDPFLRVSDMAAALRAGGIMAVTNYPTVQVVDGETGRAIAAVGYGPADELSMLLRFAAAGLEPVGCVTSAEDAARFAAAGVARLVAPPAFGSGELGFAPVTR
jgi:predicted TIM-barrel enzyme